jgi:hypothetical protein
MNTDLISSLMKNLGGMQFAAFNNLFIPNQELPASNFLVTKLSYGGNAPKTLNKVVRMAEVSDGVIVKLPVIPAVKIPFNAIKSLNVVEEEGTLNLRFQFQKNGLGNVSMQFPSEHKGQIPFLLSHQGEHTKLILPPPIVDQQKNIEDLSNWRLPKSKVTTSKNPPINLDQIDLGGKIRIFLLLLIIWKLANYFL